MMTTTALDLDYLTEAERDLILSVIRKDEELHNKDQQRVDTLKSEIKALKVKGALKPGMDAEKSCARCRQPFGWIFDRGELCPKCKQKVCEACQCKITDSGQWLCILCKKQKDLDAMSGSWFFTQFRKSKRNKNTQEVISGSDIIKTSFRKNNVNAKMNGTSRTTEDVRRALAKGSSRDHSSSPEHEGESSDTQSMEAHHRPLKKTDLHDAAFPKDSEKIMLLDLLGGPSVAPVSAYGGNRPSRVPEPIQPNVHIQRVSTRRYSDSSSGGSDGGSGPSSPQFSHRTESEYAPSESINSSFRSTSAVSSDGRYTMVTDNASVISGISTAPPSMQDSPVLNSRHSSRHATNSQSTFAESFLNNSDKPLHSTAISAKSPGGDSTHMAKKDNIGSSSDSMPEQFLQYQHLTDTGAVRDDKHQVHTVKVVSRGKSASESSTDDDELNRRYNNNKQMYDSSPQQRSPAKMEAVVAGRTYSGRQPTWARSSGSDSSSTMHGRRANSAYDSSQHQDSVLNGGVALGVTRTESEGDSSELRSDIQSDIRADDLHSEVTDTLRSEDKSGDSGFVKQDSVSSALSVPSLNVIDPSPNSSRDQDEAEDDIDDLVSNFKNKSLSKSHSHLFKPKNSNLTSSFSSSVESVTSIYSEAGEGNYGNIPVEGEIHFGMDYIYKSSTFEVHIKQCKNIAAVDTKKKRSDPYVKTYLLPDRTKSGKRKTRVRKHTLNPIFNEVLKYHIAKSELETRTLWVTVWNNDTFGRNDFLGEVTVPLDYEEFKDTTAKWYQLQEKTPVQPSLLTYKGDLNVSLKYVSADSVSSSRKLKGKVGNKGELQILVKQARNLTAVRSNGTSDPFCKGYLLPEKSKSSKQKTHVIKKNCNPQWNHTFVFEDIGFEELKEKSLELTIWDHDRFTSNDFLGGVRLGLGTGKSGGKEVDWCDSKGEEISVWQSMLDRPNHWIEATLLLRPNMNSRKAAA